MWRVRAAWLAIVAAALAFRIPALRERPMHADEAVLADKFGGLLETGSYAYDPQQYHGPALAWLTLVPARLMGAHRYADLTETTLRIVPALCGVALVLLPVLLSDGLGRWERWPRARLRQYLRPWSTTAAITSRRCFSPCLRLPPSSAATVTRAMARARARWLPAFASGLRRHHETRAAPDSDPGSLFMVRDHRRIRDRLQPRAQPAPPPPWRKLLATDAGDLQRVRDLERDDRCSWSSVPSPPKPASLRSGEMAPADPSACSSQAL